MTTPEVLSTCTNEIYENCIKNFQSKGIDPQTGLFILDSIYRKVQDLALAETTKHLSQITVQYEMLKSTLNTEEDGEDNDGDTTQTGSV